MFISSKNVNICCALRTAGDLNDYYLFYLSLKRSLAPEELRQQWLEELQSEEDISHVFCCFLSGESNRLGHKAHIA